MKIRVDPTRLETQLTRPISNPLKMTFFLTLQPDLPNLFLYFLLSIGSLCNPVIDGNNKDGFKTREKTRESMNWNFPFFWLLNQCTETYLSSFYHQSLQGVDPHFKDVHRRLEATINAHILSYRQLCLMLTKLKLF